MLCPTCNRRTKVLETRRRATGAIYRRYECVEHRFSTLESVIEDPPKAKAEQEPSHDDE